MTWSDGALLFAQLAAVVIIFLGALQQVMHLVQLLIAGYTLMRERAVPSELVWRRYAEAAPPIAILAPAHNEAAGIEQSVRSLLALQYPVFEVIVINDGSKDATLQTLIDAFELQKTERDYDEICQHQPILGVYESPNQSRLTVIDKKNGGKADALNAGINLSRAPILCSIDADSILESDALMRVSQPFVEQPDETIAAGGTIRIVNGCRVRHGRVIEVGAPQNLLALLQTVEYLRAFLMARLAWSRLGALLIISGAFGLFQRKAVVEVGGYTLGTVGEDMDLVVKLHRKALDEGRPYRIAFVPEPVCWTEAPERLDVLGRQRSRWHRGALEVYAKHRDMLGPRRYGRVGWLGMGNVLVSDVLGPVADLLGWLLVPLLWAFGLLSIDYLMAFFAVTVSLGIVVSVGALALEEMELRRFPRTRDLMRLAGAAVLENLGYRQLVSLWRLRGMWQWHRKSHVWGEMTRTGFRK